MRLIVGLLIIGTSLTAFPAAAAAGDMADGIVQTSDGTPIAGATVCIIELDLCSITPTMVAYGDGYFHIDTPYVGAASMTLTVSAPGFQDNTQPIQFQDHAGGVSYSLDNVVILEPVSQAGPDDGEPSNFTTTVVGTVIDQNGVPVEGVLISHDGTWSNGIPSEGFTDADGAFILSSQMDGYYPWEVSVSVEGCTTRGFVSWGSNDYSNVRDVGAIQLECVPLGQNGGGETIGNGDVVENSFTITVAERMCADQTFNASWIGSNLESVEFALNNTSDSWSSGWLVADPAAGSFTTAVDHHGYDKAAARATFTDGTTQQAELSTSDCANVPTEAPNPDSAPDVPETTTPGGSGSGSTSGESGSGSGSTVSGLPSTGTGTPNTNELMLTALMAAAIAFIAVPARLAWSSRQNRD